MDKDTAAGDQGMTKAELVDAMKSAAREELGPIVQEALAPLNKTQTQIAEKLFRGDGEGVAPPYQSDKDLGPYPIGRKVRALALAMLAGHPGDVAVAKAEVKKQWQLGEVEPTLKWLDFVEKNLTAGNAAAAGAMVMPQYDPRWIELLRSKAVIRGMASTYPMPRGATSRRKQTSAATAYYQGEGTAATKSQLAVGLVNLSYKKLTALTVVSNDLLRFGGAESDRIIETDLLRVVALREDRAFLYGNPPIDAGSPQGIRYQTVAGNINAASAVTLAGFQADLTASIRRVEESDVQLTEPKWIMSPATFWAIYALVTTTGDWVFKQGLDLNPPRMLGYEVVKTTALKAATLFANGHGAAAATAGLIYFVEPSVLEIHDSMQRTVNVFPGGAYYDAALAAVASGISNDETVISCIAEHDFLQVYSDAVAILTGYAT